ncbi:fluoride efflux transporter FluC [Blastococcus saxobsidens]|uniref:Fluoride-specific ion channel FluC n=1 Tax=Blastococcus saxobsidens (strain DD2) TaxID=1146883 RepID=H6RV32_BLASD|nr:CrcB family protein [Blastococcus saxobsidens]CCG05751.1 Camphor resistance protein CrcB [Blastococcus saxobsidens DD2]
MTPLLVALGAAVGAPLRLLVTRVAGRDGRDPAPGTLVVNVVGSVVLGVLLGLADVPAAVLALVGGGFCGALTTFSTFGVDAVRLRTEGTSGRSLAYVATTLVLGIGAAAAGYLVAGAL